MVEVDPAIAQIHQTAAQPTTEEIPDGTLFHSYTLYAQNKSDGWDEKNIKAFANFSTIDQFWAMYQHMKRPSQMPEGTTINLFVKGVKPVWEDPQHKQGGSLRLQISKGYANQIWEDLMLVLIGEQFELANEITGIVLSVGRTDKISIWYRHGTESRVTGQIKADMIRLLGLPQDVKIQFSLFFPDKEGGNTHQHKGKDHRQDQGQRKDRGHRELASYQSSMKPAVEETKALEQTLE